MKKLLSKRTSSVGHSIEAYCPGCGQCSCASAAVRGSADSNAARLSS